MKNYMSNPWSGIEWATTDDRDCLILKQVRRSRSSVAAAATFLLRRMFAANGTSFGTADGSPETRVTYHVRYHKDCGLQAV